MDIEAAGSEPVAARRLRWARLVMGLSAVLLLVWLGAWLLLWIQPQVPMGAEARESWPDTGELAYLDDQQRAAWVFPWGMLGLVILGAAEVGAAILAAVTRRLPTGWMLALGLSGLLLLAGPFVVFRAAEPLLLPAEPSMGDG